MRLLKFILIIIFIFFINKINAQTKHALIIAVGNYPKAKGWETISSLRDVGFVDTALVKQGFLRSNISILTDKKVTPTGIQNAIIQLINRVKPGDVVVMHVSSHGEQIADDNNDEADGLDEAIVTYNAISPLKFKLDKYGNIVSIAEYNKAQAEYFRDDKFGSLVNDLRSKLGKEGDVLVFMDLCHSGTGLRGAAKMRGGQPAMVPSGFDVKKYLSTDTSVYVEKMVKKLDENLLATYVAVAAARADELNYEASDEYGQGIGSLSYAVSKVFQNLDSLTTYRSMFSKIEAAMHETTPEQHPALEGDGIDRLLFGGRFISQKNFIEITEINGSTVKLNSGLFSGLDTGAVIGIYPAGTFDPAVATMLASGKITSSNAYSSVASIEGTLNIFQPSLGWVFITKPVYNVKPIVLQIEPLSRGANAKGFSSADISTIKNNLSALPIITFIGTPELQFVKGERDTIKLAVTGTVFDVIDNAIVNPDELLAVLKRYSQYKFLTNLEINDPDINVEVRLVPFVGGKADTLAIKRKMINEFTEGDKFVLFINNKSTTDIYVNILDIQPDGIINSILPNKAQRILKGDLLINAKSSYLFSNYVIKVAPPYGIEVFKIFASKEPLDVEDLATTKGVTPRSSLQVLETLIQRSYNVRGAEGTNISTNNGSTYNLIFKINAKK